MSLSLYRPALFLLKPVHRTNDTESRIRLDHTSAKSVIAFFRRFLGVKNGRVLHAHFSGSCSASFSGSDAELLSEFGKLSFLHVLKFGHQSKMQRRIKTSYAFSCKRSTK